MAKIKAKASYKDVKSKFKENKDELKDDSSNSQSAPSSPTTSRSSTIAYSQPAPLTRNNTDLNFGRVLKYERFDPPDERRELSPEFEEMPRLEYNLMSELDEIMMRNKSGSMGVVEKRVGNSDMSSMSAPRKSSTVNSERKSSVGDLISLATEQEHTVVFDPLLDKQIFPHNNPHKRLERTSNSSSGKYENYVPPGGSSQPQFRQFLSTMTEQPVGQNTPNPSLRSSNDLLTEYGINFKSANISSNPQPAPRHSSFSHPFHHNNLPAPTLPPRTVNTSFLHTSGTSLLTQATTTSTLPINTRLSPMSPQTIPSCKDILADLDPLRSGREAAGYQHGFPASTRGAVMGGTYQLQPPTVPPRIKKQWTTFD